MKDKEYSSLVERLVAYGQADDRIVALLVYGSRATGRADAFSDLDVGLVTTDADYDDVIAHAGDLARTLGEPLFIENFGNPAGIHVILADGAELELIIDREAELTLDLPHRVLLDKAGVVERARKRPPAAPGPVITADEVERRVQWFWHDVGHVITALGRGNTWWAYGQLDELRRMCLNLARLEAGSPADDEAYWKIDEAIPAERLAALRGTLAAPEPRPMLEAALALVDLYRDIATRLAADHGVAYPVALDRLLSAQLRDIGTP